MTFPPSMSKQRGWKSNNQLNRELKVKAKILEENKEGENGCIKHKLKRLHKDKD